MLWNINDNFINNLNNNIPMKEDALHALGLNDKEIKIYLSNLELGSSLVQNIAKRVQMNRTSAYDILKSLEHKGFASYTITSGKRYYQATNPKKLLDMLKEKEDLIKKALPELNIITESVGYKPNIEIYTGKDGLKSIFEDVLRNCTSFCGLASKRSLLQVFKYYLPHFVERRKKAKIKVRLISDSVPLDKDAPHKIIKKKLKTATYMYNGRIAMVSLEEKEPIGIIIHEKNFYKTHMMMFEMLWDSL